MSAVFDIKVDPVRRGNWLGTRLEYSTQLDEAIDWEQG